MRPNINSGYPVTYWLQHTQPLTREDVVAAFKDAVRRAARRRIETPQEWIDRKGWR